MKDKRKSLERLCRQFDLFLTQIYQSEHKVIVFGEGNPDASVMLVGEAPGEQETRMQRPFVGQAGRNLDAFLEILELKREDIYITNVVKFRPVRVSDSGRRANRPPTLEEVALCKSCLIDEITLIKPDIIVTLGNVALRAVIGNKALTIGQAHGGLISCPYGHLFPLYHPASILYNRTLKQVYEDDLRALKQVLRSRAMAAPGEDQP